MEKRSLVVDGEPYRVTGNGRRYFSKSHKEAVIAKNLAQGASLAAVALANGFNANLVRKWVREHGVGETLARSSSKLLPVTLDTEPGRGLRRRMQAPAKAKTQARKAAVGSMEIRIGTIELVVHGLVDRAQLSEVLDRLLRS